MTHLGIIAGGGTLPQKLIDACRRANTPVFALALEGQAEDKVVSAVPHEWVPLGATNEAIRILKAHGVDTAVLAGGIKSWFRNLRPDWRTIKILARLGPAAFGDDAILRAVAAELEKDGIKVIGAHEIEPDLLTPHGVLTKKRPSAANLADIDEGIKIVKSLGQMDVGQAAVIRNSTVLGLEGPDGTDALLKRCRDMTRDGVTGGVLIKACKPQQDKRLDLPTIGIRTVRHVYEAGLEGIAIECGQSLIVDRDEVIADADKLGLFLTGFKTA